MRSVVTQAHGGFAGHPIRDFVPVFVERVARDELIRDTRGHPTTADPDAAWVGTGLWSHNQSIRWLSETCSHGWVCDSDVPPVPGSSLSGGRRSEPLVGRETLFDPGGGGE